MLLNLELKLKITNDGKNNYVSIIADKDIKVKDIATAIAMAAETPSSMLSSYIKKKDIPANQVNKVINSITLGELEKQ